MSSLPCLLLGLLLAIGSAHATPTAAGSATPEVRQTQRLLEVADGIRVFVASEAGGGIVQGNVTVISGRDASLLIDSGQYPSLAREMVTALQQANIPPVRWLLNSHWHGDHLLCNHLFAAAWPQLQVIQHRETARLGALEYADWNSKGSQPTREVMQQIRAILDQGTLPDGRPLPALRREAFEIDLQLGERWLAEASDTRWRPGDLLLDGELEIDLGGRHVLLKPVGHANTEGDIVAWDAQTRTLVSGDVLVAPTPYAFGSDLGHWIESLDALQALQPALIVPGHGEPMHDLAYLQRVRELLQATRERVQAALATQPDIALDALRKQVDLADFEQRFAGERSIRQRAFRDFYLQPAIERALLAARPSTGGE